MFTATEYRQWIEAPTEAAAIDVMIAATRRLEREAQLAERYVPESPTWGTAPEYAPELEPWQCEPAWMAEAMEAHHG